MSRISLEQLRLEPNAPPLRVIRQHNALVGLLERIINTDLVSHKKGYRTEVEGEINGYLAALRIGGA